MKGNETKGEKDENEIYQEKIHFLMEANGWNFLRNFYGQFFIETWR